MSERLPTMMQHALMMNRREIDRLNARLSNGLTATVEINGRDREWFIDTVIKGTTTDDIVLDVIIRQRFIRDSKRSARWSSYNPTVIKDGEERAENNKDVSAIIEELLAQRSPTVGDLTGSHRANTRGSRNNSVETRRASVIRV